MEQVFSGSLIAAKILKEFKTRQPITIAKKLGIKIKYFQQKPLAGIIRYSGYQSSPPTILINKNCLNLKWLKEKISPLVNFPLKSRIYLLVAHELYHHLERTKSKKKFNPFGIRQGKYKRSEKEAKDFAMTLIGTLDF